MRVSAFVLTTAALVTLVAGCDSADSPSARAQPVPSSPARAESAPSAPPASRPAPSPSVSTSPPVVKKLKSGAKGALVVELQQRLTALGYWNGRPDGKFGSTTQQAVYAVQKAAGLDRDGVVGPRTQRAIDAGVLPTARSKAGTGHVVEISLDRQLLMFVDDGRVTQVLNTATGSNRNYQQNGQTYLADTPPGRFRVGRQIDGWRHAPLGLLWRPKYFNGGIAVHGAASVPPYPASHGCARVSIAAMNWIWTEQKIPLKTRVWVY
jgi:peptidoglycan hydrolase-like protein with peptidoglycan-binding domain